MNEMQTHVPFLLQFDPTVHKTMLLFEAGRKEYVQESSLEYIENMCLRHGSTLQGRRDAICRTLKIHQKAPILISEGLRLLYFPLTSPQRHPDAVWLCYNRMRKCVDLGDGMSSTVLFMDGTSFVVHEQSRTVLKQYRKCNEYVRYLNEQEQGSSERFDLAHLKERLSL